MNQFRNFVTRALISGVLVVVPTYLAVLLLLQAMRSMAGLVRPVAILLPDWLPGESLLALLLVLTICFVIGAAIRTKSGRAVIERLEKSVFVRIPGYTLVRGLTQQLVGEDREGAWKPALVELEDALVPAFIIEELEDGRYTVFVPSSPSPFAGAVYILSRHRVHPLKAPFLETVQTLSRWGSGSKNLVAAMESENTVR